MSLKRISKIFALAVIPVLAGFFLAAQANMDNGIASAPGAPGIILPGDNGQGALSIIPTDDTKTRVEYRKIFGWGKDKDKGEAGKTDSGVMDRDIKDPATSGSMTPSSPGTTDQDKDTGSSAPGTTSEKSPGNSGSFRYILWPFSESTDKSVDKDKSIDQGGKESSSIPDKDIADRDVQEEQEDVRDKGGLRYILEESAESESTEMQPSDRDVTEDTEKSLDSTDKIIILAGMGGSKAGMGSGKMGAPDHGSGDTSARGSSRDLDSRNMDVGSKDKDMGSSSERHMEHDSKAKDSDSKDMDISDKDVSEDVSEID